MKRILFYLLISSVASTLYCQQQPISSQYIFNKYFVNPAYAGSTSDFPVSASYRKLWAGIKDAPSMQILSGHMEVANRMGVGLKVYNVSSGPLSRTGLTATYAYHVPLNSNGDKLAFGLSGLLYQYKIDRASLDLENPDDEAVTGSNKTLVPDATFGTYLYGGKYYVGLTVSQLFQRKIDLLKNNVFEQRQVRHYYLHGGYKFDITDDITLEPSALLKLIEAGVFQADINVIGSYNDMIWGGLTFRPMSAVIILLGFQYDPFYIGYSYDMSLSDIRIQSYGSHEILLIYRIKNFLR